MNLRVYHRDFAPGASVAVTQLREGFLRQGFAGKFRAKIDRSHPVDPYQSTFRIAADAPFQDWPDLLESILPLRHLPAHLQPNGLDTAVFKPRDRTEARRRFSLPESALVVGAVAHGGVVANQWKGWSFTREVLETTLSRFPDVYYANIGGEGPSTHPRIRNIPRIEDEAELSLAYSALDLFLYTPTADNCPLVILESLASGVPVATFDTGGTAEHLEF